MLTLVHRGLLAATFLVIAVLGCAQSAAAATHSCSRSGYTTEFRDAHNAVLWRKVSGRRWEEGPFRLYACSTRYGRFVPLGSRGVSPDGPQAVTIHALNDRYVASAISWTDNGDGGWAGGAITVRDMKTRKRLYTTSGDHAGSQFLPSAVTLSDRGDLGWTVDPGRSDRLREIWKRDRTAIEPTRLATGVTIDPELLRWSTDGERLVWAEPSLALDFQPRRLRNSDSLHGGRCAKQGDNVVGRGYGYVYLTRAFNAPDWKRGRVLIACSLLYKRRVALAHSGEFNGKKYRFELPVVNEGFGAVIEHQVNADGSELSRLMLSDLGREERLCLADVADGLTDVSVPAVRIDATGNAAWSVTGLDPAGEKSTQVRVCDDAAVRTLAAGKDLDPLLLRIDLESRTVFTARNSKSAT